LEGHVLCQRMLIGPCAFTTLGAATDAAAAKAAPLRNLRRELLPPEGAFACAIVSSRMCGLAARFLQGY
jgi:hypothetical protein